uniref:Phlebovirus glycoprotein G2 fusion domain-containing protein n=1 Tax=Globodera rostochiensis TaxID=31243 RepID=A0A914I1M3_GLORO
MALCLISLIGNAIANSTCPECLLHCSMSGVTIYGPSGNQKLDVCCGDVCIVRNQVRQLAYELPPETLLADYTCVARFWTSPKTMFVSSVTCPALNECTLLSCTFCIELLANPSCSPEVAASLWAIILVGMLVGLCGLLSLCRSCRENFRLMMALLKPIGACLRICRRKATRAHTRARSSLPKRSDRNPLHGQQSHHAHIAPGGTIHNPNGSRRARSCARNAQFGAERFDDGVRDQIGGMVPLIRRGEQIKFPLPESSKQQLFWQHVRGGKTGRQTMGIERRKRLARPLALPGQPRELGKGMRALAFERLSILPHLEMNSDSESNHETEAILYPGMHFHWHNITLTPLAISLPPAPILSSKFITSEDAVALVEQLGDDLHCSDEASARDFNCTLAPTACSGCSADHETGVVGCSCRDLNLEERIDDPQQRLPLTIGQFHLRNEESRILADTGYSPVQLHVEMRDVEMILQLRDSKCWIEALNISGCYRSLTGAQFWYQCRTDWGRALAKVECADGTIFAASCSTNQSAQREVRLSTVQLSTVGLSTVQLSGPHFNTLSKSDFYILKKK